MYIDYIQACFKTRRITQTKIEETRHTITPLDLIDFSNSLVFSKWTTAYFTSLWANSIL